jgi:hypothetical protein
MTAVERRIRINDWLIPYDDATEEVTVERKLHDILTATPGDDQDCMNSRCIRAQRNHHVFPHPVFIVSTIRSRVYVVDKLDAAGNPAHAIRYELAKRDRDLVNAHDRWGAGEPGELRLRIPHDPKGSPKRAARAGRRYADADSPGKRGTGARRHPVTSHSLGAKARFKVAVGALRGNE